MAVAWYRLCRQLQMFSRSGRDLNILPTAAHYGPSVAIIRTLRDGSITHEYLPEFLAEQVVAMIPFDEPLVASARIAYSELLRRV